MRYQGFILASEQGQDTPKFTGRERVVGSRWFVCQGLEQRQEPACFSAGTQCGLRGVCQGLAQGQEPAWFSAGPVRRAQEDVSGMDHGPDPASFRARTAMGDPEYVLGDRTRARPRLVQCRDRDAFSGVFLGVRTQPGSVWGQNAGSAVFLG